MRAGALAPYEDALTDAAPLTLVAADGCRLDLDVARWLGPADSADATVVDRCTGPVLDVGCGPGRFVRALTDRGIAALGLDIAAAAIAHARRRNVPALMRSVFDPSLAEGYWPTVLLMDGNVGIGGDVISLLRRVRALLAPGGRLLVETAGDPSADRAMRMRFSRSGGIVGPSFDWSEVGIDALRRHAIATGYTLAETWIAGGRTFAVLAR